MKIASLICLFLFFPIAVSVNAGARLLPDSLGAYVTGAKPQDDIEDIESEYVRLYQKGDYNRALSLAKKVLESREAKFGSNHISVSDTLSNIATIFMAMDKPNQAQPLLKRVVDIHEKLFGATNPETLKALERYACFLWNFGKKKEAEEAENRILAILYPNAEKFLEENVTKAKATRRVPPRYPDELRAARVGGTVIVRIVIDESGNVIEASGRCGDPLFVQAAVEAARAWKFKPSLVNGVPVQTGGRLTFTFVAP